MALLSRKPVEARRIGHTLVATFHRANPPLIWRFDLERNHSFTLALQGEDDEWELGLTSPKGDFYGVARFASREDADESFALIGEAIADQQVPWWRLVLKGIGFSLIAFVLCLIGFGVMVGHDVQALLHPAMTGASSGAAAPPTPVPHAIRNGVPQSADDVLAPP